MLKRKIEESEEAHNLKSDHLVKEANQKMEEEMFSLEEKNKNLEDEIQERSNKIKELIEMMSNANLKISEKEQEKKDMKKSINDMEININNKNDETRFLNDSIKKEKDNTLEIGKMKEELQVTIVKLEKTIAEKDLKIKKWPRERE